MWGHVLPPVGWMSNKPSSFSPQIPSNQHVVLHSSNSKFTRSIKVSRRWTHECPNINIDSMSDTLLSLKCDISDHDRNVWHFSRECGWKRCLVVQYIMTIDLNWFSFSTSHPLCNRLLFLCRVPAPGGTLSAILWLPVELLMQAIRQELGHSPRWDQTRTDLA